MAHRFQFFRAGGVDQVSLTNGGDILALSELDQKLWVALAMPVKGTAIDPATLAILDGDGDGKIHVGDILATVAWVKTAFKQPNDLLAKRSEVQLSAIADDTIVAAAKRMLSDLGKKEATSISVDDTLAIEKAYLETVLNGDGIIIDASSMEADIKKAIADAVTTVGAVTDRSGKPGLDKAHADEFFTAVDARQAWLAKKESPLGDKTDAAAGALAAVRAKVEDFFIRCRVAAYDPRGQAAMTGQDTDFVAIGHHDLAATDAELEKLPLALVEPSARLPLRTGVNPTWAARLEAFARDTVDPIVGPRDVLTPGDFDQILAKLAPYKAWQDAKPVTKVDALEPAWIATLAAPHTRDEVARLIAADSSLGAEYEKISAVVKLVRLQRDFGRILRNFVNFSDFYTNQDGAFQAGTLYLDARALRLCVPVTDPAKHAALAASSDAYLAYCDLTRKGEPPRQIAAALTNGDADAVFVGRNGLFYDRDGNDWDATITKIVSNPISVRAAFWSPYKKLVKTIEETVEKRAQAAEAASMKTMEATGADVGTADKKAIADASAPPPPPPPPTAPPEAPKVDLGTVAAIGVAIGGIGTLVGALLANLFGLGMWLPVGIVALMLMISGPSMLLAWLKLRRRNLGPILDANGWAINGRARINVAFGAAMTELAKLPAGSSRSLDDKYADKRTPWKRWVAIIVLLGLSGLWYLGKLDDYLPEKATSVGVMGEGAPAWKAQHPPAPPTDPKKK